MRALLIWAAAIWVALTAAASADRLELWIDADYSVAPAAAEAIELGVRTALSLEPELGEAEIVVLPRDHRGNAKRSHHTMQQFLESDDALAIIGGMHSPPYLTHRDFINERRILTLLPWSAAGPITRAATSDNWIFRLSVDDHQSGHFLIREAVVRGGCERVALVLLESGWGRANLKTLTRELAAQGQRPVAVRFYNGAIGPASARTIAEEIASASPDCGILLSNWNAGALIVNALGAELPEFRLFSHWGIMGGAFADHVPHETRGAMGLVVLQTCGLRRDREGNATLSAAIAASGRDIGTLSDLAAPTGFVHGHDLTRILVAAIRQAAQTDAWRTGRIEARRAAVRDALETLGTRIDGILGTYDPPFRPYSAADPDAHEALGLSDLCLARFGKDGMLIDVD